MNWYTTSWSRSSKRSSRVLWPAGVSNTYPVSNSVMGRRLRCAASASSARVASFSAASRASRAWRQSWAETMGGVAVFSGMVRVLSSTPGGRSKDTTEHGPGFRHTQRKKWRGGHGDRRPPRAGILDFAGTGPGGDDCRDAGRVLEGVRVVVACFLDRARGDDGILGIDVDVVAGHDS